METKLELIEISLYEFKKDIYDKHVNIFLSKKKRSFNSISINVKRGITHLIKIVQSKINIGFFILNILPNNKYIYLDYFTIFEKYRNLGYGKSSIKKLQQKYNNYGLFLEIEKFSDEFDSRIREFCKKIGFKNLDFDIELLGKKYVPYILNCINCNEIIYDKDLIIQNIFDIYYSLLGDKMLNNNCKVLC